MDKIKIVDLEVYFQLGLSDEERAKPQRLLVSVELLLDLTSAALSDRVQRTIDYFEVSQTLLKFGDGRNWRLLEKLTGNIAEHIFAVFKPAAVTVEVKKFVIPQAQYVSVVMTRSRARQPVR